MKKYKWFFLSAFASLLIACGQGAGTTSSTSNNEDAEEVVSEIVSEVIDTVNTVETSNEPPLSLSYASGLAKQIVKCEHSIDNVDIDFGCLLKSGSFSLFPQNNSEFELTDLEISVDNSQFEITPSKIASIGVAGKSAASIPVIKLSINHRTPLNSLAETDPLPFGENFGIITITGFVNNEPFTLITKVGVYGESMQLKRHDDGILYLEGPIFLNDTLRTMTRVYEDDLDDSTPYPTEALAFLSAGWMMLATRESVCVWGSQFYKEINVNDNIKVDTTSY